MGENERKTDRGDDMDPNDARLRLLERRYFRVMQSLRTHAICDTCECVRGCLAGCIRALMSRQKGLAMVARYTVAASSDHPAASASPNATDYTTGTPFAEDSVLSHAAATLFYTAYHILAQEPRWISLRWGSTRPGELEVPHEVSNVSHTKLATRCGVTDVVLLDRNLNQSPQVQVCASACWRACVH